MLITIADLLHKNALLLQTNKTKHTVMAKKETKQEKTCYSPEELQEFKDKFVIKSVESPSKGFSIGRSDGNIERLHGKENIFAWTCLEFDLSEFFLRKNYSKAFLFYFIFQF